MQQRNIPKGTFWIGGFCGAVLGIPLLTLVLSLFEPSVPLSLIFFHAAGFAGIPALVTTGGVARWTARRLAEGDRPPSVGTAFRISAPALAVAGAGWAILVLVPLGPPLPLSWGPELVGGAAAGIVTAAAVTVLVGVRQKRHTDESPPAS
jgi:hypothetical protein